MPTNQNAYNSRVTDEALEKKFRDTFKSQGGAELVDDLYASGVIVPVVDFTAAAEGSALREDLQKAWDLATLPFTVKNTTITAVSTTGFWQCEVVVTLNPVQTAIQSANVYINDGTSNKQIWAVTEEVGGSTNTAIVSYQWSGIAYLTSGDSIKLYSSSNNVHMNAFFRQIADVNGNLTNPLGFTSS